MKKLLLSLITLSLLIVSCETEKKPDPAPIVDSYTITTDGKIAISNVTVKLKNGTERPLQEGSIIYATFKDPQTGASILEETQYENRIARFDLSSAASKIVTQMSIRQFIDQFIPKAEISDESARFEPLFFAVEENGIYIGDAIVDGLLQNNIQHNVIYVTKTTTIKGTYKGEGSICSADLTLNEGFNDLTRTTTIKQLDDVELIITANNLPATGLRWMVKDASQL